MEIFRELRGKGLPVYKDTYFAALEACERLGLWTEGRAVLEAMQVGLLYMKAPIHGYTDTQSQ